MVLSNEYQGQTFVDTYAVDPTNQKAIDLKIDWSISINMINKTVSGHGSHNANYRLAEEHTMELINFLSARRMLDKKMAVSREKLLAKHGVGPDENVSLEKGRAMAGEYIDMMMGEVDHLLLGGLNAKLKKHDT